MGVFSLSCWKPQVTAGLNSGGNLFPLLPFITQSSEGEGQKVAISHFRQLSSQPTPSPQAYLSVSDIPPREGSPGKNVCQTSAWDSAGPSAGLCHSGELHTHHLLVPASSSSQGAHQTSRLSQRLHESMRSSCDHCHKDRVP